MRVIGIAEVLGGAVQHEVLQLVAALQDARRLATPSELDAHALIQIFGQLENRLPAALLHGLVGHFEAVDDRYPGWVKVRQLNKGSWKPSI